MWVKRRILHCTAISSVDEPLLTPGVYKGAVCMMDGKCVTNRKCYCVSTFTGRMARMHGGRTIALQFLARTSRQGDKAEMTRLNMWMRSDGERVPLHHADGVSAQRQNVSLTISDATSSLRALPFSMVVSLLSVIRVARIFRPLLPSRKTPAHNTTNTPDPTQNNRHTISRHRRTSKSRKHRASRDTSNTRLNTRCNTP